MIDDGNEFWCKHGNLHREDGPAAVWLSGRKSWYLNGQQLSKAEFDKAVQQKFNKELASKDGAIFDNDFLDGL